MTEPFNVFRLTPCCPLLYNFATGYSWQQSMWTKRVITSTVTGNSRVHPHWSLLYHVRGEKGLQLVRSFTDSAVWRLAWANCEKVKYENAGSSPGWDPQSPGLVLTVHRQADMVKSQWDSRVNCIS